ncbi:MAG: hypothetical protein O4803_05305 [Trichodesmium sp. St15_bin1_1]|mgnify:FL=1|jgi:hypothetical protein|nr:hypothetical protein [Trichodesmium sp. MAG_R02]MDE5075203.1 hypothetical protein [Trichodesmium sp. St5_bin2_1]MDE5083787.1 hypothetical protein [Trichodesmium sp. St18_bin1]MDE5110801.1 hypothetical protein [Trichodesmium sp. St7_bin2_1]MDE5113700.1 hypothetical protein [Trichodesmium sp. St15_bin1_1]MDE5123664.1 hypothetical protein [Trichodesmium sp. St19_bin1]
MPYSKFTLDELKQKFNIILTGNKGKFNNLPEVAPSQFILEALEEYLPLAVAIGSEKARSELIVAPILVAIKKHLNKQISLFSGIEFNVDIELGLNGFCDFIISNSTQQFFIESPVIALVEAKNDNLKSGLAQCMAEMVAAQIFNQRQDNEVSKIYGVITTGTVWQFLELEGEAVVLDLQEYSVENLPKILGILTSFVS